MIKFFAVHYFNKYLIKFLLSNILFAQANKNINYFYFFCELLFDVFIQYEFNLIIQIVHEKNIKNEINHIDINIHNKYIN